MIEFSCKQCGLAHARPPEEAGTFFHCECGCKNRVPWGASKPVDPVDLTAAQESDTVVTVLEETDAVDAVPVAVPRDGEICFQHEQAAATNRCADCGVKFCEACVVQLQGDRLCGPCKNLRLRRLQRPTRLSVPALLSSLFSLAAAPVILYVAGMASQSHHAGVGIFGALVPLTAMVLGTVALVQIERDPECTGRSLAITGVVAGLVGAVLDILITAYVAANA